MAREIKGTFRVETHEEYGILGVRPEWMPNADPLMGIAVAHDLLEHFPGDDGGVEAEFMALGASYLIRGETGFHQRNGNVNRPEDHIAADFVELYRHVAYEDFTLLDPGTVEPIEDEHADATLEAAARLGVNLVRDEESYHNNSDEDNEDVALFCCDQSRERILGWMRKGYRKAQERYAGIDVYTLAYSVFGEIESRVDAWLNGSAEEGMLLDVTIDLDRLSVTLEAGYGVDETDYCGECEGTGELDGEAEGNYHDCPRALDGCNPANPSPDCPECKGEGYIAPPVKCDTCEGSGEVDATYRESI